MTRFLASVRNWQEAEIALAAGADIIDLKNPDQGALGAVDLDTVAAVVEAVNGSAPVSATVGDPPMPPEVLRPRIDGLIAARVDYVKIGFDAQTAVEVSGGAKFIAVVFADRVWDLDFVARACDAGFAGIMLDTAGKAAGSLLDHCSEAALRGFLDAAGAQGLLAGLAGSLRERHVPQLLPLNPDVLGFRGALCRQHARSQAIDAAACLRLRAQIPRHAPQPDDTALEPSPFLASYPCTMRANADC